MTQLQPSRFKQAEFQRAIYAITPEVGTPFDALLLPGYWAHVSMHFRPGCHIEVYPPEAEYYAELIVQDCGALWAKVAVLRKVELVPVAMGKEPDLKGFEVGYGGDNLLWCVYRKVNGKKDRLKSECGTKDEAENWLKQHARTVAPRPAAA